MGKEQERVGVPSEQQREIRREQHCQRKTSRGVEKVRHVPGQMQTDLAGSTVGFQMVMSMMVQTSPRTGPEKEQDEKSAGEALPAFRSCVSRIQCHLQSGGRSNRFL